MHFAHPPTLLVGQIQGWKFFCTRENISSETTFRIEQRERLQLFMSNLNSFVGMACLKRKHSMPFYAMIATQYNHFQICPTLRWQFYSFKNLLASQRKCFKSSYSHEKNCRIYLVNQCVCLLQKDVVGWGFPWIAMDWQVIGGHLSVYYICKLLSGLKMLLVQICLV